MNSRPGIRLIQQLRDALNPSVEFEQRTYRTRLARRTLIAFFIILGAWLLAVIFLRVFLPGPVLLPFAFNLLAIAGAALAGLAAGLLLRHDRVVASGYLMALSAFVIGSVNAIIAPNAVHLSSAALILSTLLAGAIVGGGAAYLFAIATILVTAASWASARLYAIGGIAKLNAQGGLIYLLTVSVAAVATAGIIQSLSGQVQRTIDRLHSQAQRLASLANTDPLTKLANRRYLLEQLEREFERARRYTRPMSLVYIDLDGFKAVNDRFGHLFGDDVLQGAAKAMQPVLRTTDLLARIGGDEFAVLMPETTIEGAQNAAAKLRRALAAYSEQLGPAVPTLSFCAGISQLRPEDDNIEDILRRADDAQYLAKATGKDHTRTERDVPRQAPSN